MRDVTDGCHIVSPSRIKQGFFCSGMRAPRVVVDKNRTQLALATLSAYRNVWISNQILWPTPTIVSVKYPNRLVEGKLSQIESPEPGGKTEQHP